MNNQIPTLYTDDYLLGILGIKDKRKIREHIGKGNLKCLKIGRQYRYTQDQINEFINNLKV